MKTAFHGLYSQTINTRVRKVWSSNLVYILYNVAIGSPPLNIYASSCVALAVWPGDGYRQLVTHFSVIRRM